MEESSCLNCIARIKSKVTFFFFCFLSNTQHTKYVVNICATRTNAMNSRLCCCSFAPNFRFCFQPTLYCIHRHSRSCFDILKSNDDHSSLRKKNETNVSIEVKSHGCKMSKNDQSKHSHTI